jgi:RND family efflux transporter MFP subunit
MNKIIKIVAAVILIGGLLFVGYMLLFQTEKKEEAEIIKAEENNTTDKKVKKEAPLPVKVIEVKKGALPLRLRVSATADVWEKSTIKSEVQGKITSIHCLIGDWVQRGKLLVKVDDSEKKLEVESKMALKLQTLSKFLVKESMESYINPELTDKQKEELEKKKSTYTKALKDFENGKISETQFDKIKDEYEKATVSYGVKRDEVLRANENLTDAIVALKKAELDLRRTSIRSPFPGFIADLKVSKGEIISIGQEILKIINLKSLYLKGFALESELRNLKKGIKARIKFDSFPDRYFYGEIQSISPEVDTDKKTITIYVKMDNEENLIFPGMNAEMDIEYRTHENVIKVPRKAVIVRQDRPLVFAIINISGTRGVADWRYVELGAHNDEEVEIKSGIQVGDKVVIEGQLTLAHQSKVKIVK